MKRMKRAEIKQAAFNEVNHIRGLIGLEKLKELPKGQRQVACDCVIARALELSSCGYTFMNFKETESVERLRRAGYVTSERLAVATPVSLARFIARFDRGEFPELEEGLSL